MTNREHADGLAASYDQPSITIYRNGLLSLNHETYRAFAAPSAVELLFDRSAKLIGLRPVDPRERHAYPVRPASGRDTGPYLVSAGAFARFYDIELTESLRWPAVIRNGVLYADLTGPAVPVGPLATRRTAQLSN